MAGTKEAAHGVHNEGLIEAFARTTEDIVSLAEFRRLLDSGRKLRIKFGADVTASFLHLGHAVNLWMMREMQERGHLVQFLIGDFTTRVGDPTGRAGSRVPPSREAIDRDAEAFKRQVARVLITDDPGVFEVRHNSEWWDRKGLADFLSIAGGVTAGKLLSRDMFRARAEAGSEVRLDEMVYPLLQGWDSVELASDLTIVGSDQLFNESMGRFFQSRAGLQPQVIITTRITPGLDGVRKQSKTLGNFVAIDDSAREMFGKVMSLPDQLIQPWFEVYTLVPVRHIQEACARGPREGKLALAAAIVARWHGEAAASDERAWFEATFSRGGFPEDAALLMMEGGRISALDLAARAAPGLSRSELRRIISQGGAWLEGIPLPGLEAVVELAPGRDYRFRLGKRRFFTLRVAITSAKD